jgi:hypothetical protein
MRHSGQQAAVNMWYRVWPHLRVRVVARQPTSRQYQMRT